MERQSVDLAFVRLDDCQDRCTDHLHEIGIAQPHHIVPSLGSVFSLERRSCCCRWTARADMTVWRYIQRLYSLDTLDTRLTTSSKTPANPSGEVPDSKEKRDVASQARPSLWNTPEYYFYYFIFITIVPLMFYVPYSVSKRKNCGRYPSVPKLN